MISDPVPNKEGAEARKLVDTGWPPCGESQADGVPCEELRRDCEDCERSEPPAEDTGW